MRHGARRGGQRDAGDGLQEGRKPAGAGGDGGGFGGVEVGFGWMAMELVKAGQVDGAKRVLKINCELRPNATAGCAGRAEVQ